MHIGTGRIKHNIQLIKELKFIITFYFVNEHYYYVTRET